MTKTNLVSYLFSAAAEAILQTAKRVTDQLALAEEAQLKAQQAISTADENIENAETYLTQVSSAVTTCLNVN